MTEREILQKKIAAYKFAVAEMNLFLDTHPYDTASVMKRGEFLRELEPLIQEYESKFGPLRKSQNHTNTWAWVKDPWPWNTEDEI